MYFNFLHRYIDNFKESEDFVGHKDLLKLLSGHCNSVYLYVLPLLSNTSCNYALQSFFKKHACARACTHTLYTMAN